MSRIEQLIDEIEEFIESCKPQPFSQSKVVVPKDELYELLTELRLKTPEEIKRYQKIIANRDKIISDAQAQAEKMLEMLSSSAYKAGDTKYAFLLHSVGHMPRGGEVDASIIYADYYYLEALIRFKRLQEKRSILANL